MALRIGHGYDIHKFGGEQALCLGGTTIENAPGLEGHSDADVLLHAILDAFLGAIALGDIGQWFPDTDPQLKDISSVTLASHILDAPETANWRIVNLDTTIIAQRPRLTPHVYSIRQATATTMRTPEETVSVKATTNEGMDATGRGEAIATYCVILLESQEIDD
mgnify:CR=1 FL=1